MLSFVQHHEHFFHEISVVGLREMYEAKHAVVRILWAFFLISGVALTSYFVFYVVDDYMKNQMVTKVYYEINEKYQFPDTYIVAEFHDDPTVWSNFNFSAEALGYLKSLLFYNPPYGINQSLYITGKDEIKTFATVRGLTNMSDLYLMLKPQMKERFNITCKNCNDTNLGNDAYFWINFIYFKISFNTASPASHIWRAPYIIDIEVYDPAQILYLSSGRPYIQSFQNDLFNLDVNLTYEFRIDARHIKRLESNSRGCLQEFPKNSSCLNDCFKDIMTTCSNCVSSAFGNEPIFVKGYAGLDICSTLKHDYMNCFEPRDAILLDCHKNCKPLCNEINYQYSVVKARPLKSAMNSIHIEFRLMFTDTGILTLEEVQSYSIQTAASNIGGQLGLWLGLSAIYIIQMWMFCLTRCLEAKERLKKPVEDKVFEISISKSGVRA